MSTRYLPVSDGPRVPTPTGTVQSAGPSADDIEIRRLDRGDVAALARLYEDLSPSARYLRFLSSMPTLPGWFLAQLADADGVSHVVLVAYCGERPIGEARFVRSASDPDAAAVAVAVVDDRRRRGVARALLAALAGEARHFGIRRFTFDVSPSNGPVLSLLRRRAARVEFDDGVMTGELPVGALLRDAPTAVAAEDLALSA